MAQTGRGDNVQAAPTFAADAVTMNAVTTNDAPAWRTIHIPPNARNTSYGVGEIQRGNIRTDNIPVLNPLHNTDYDNYYRLHQAVTAHDTPALDPNAQRAIMRDDNIGIPVPMEPVERHTAPITQAMGTLVATLAYVLYKKGILSPGDYQRMAEVSDTSFEELISRLIEVADN